MIRRVFDSSKLDTAWRQKAKNKTDAVVAAYEKWRIEHPDERFVPKDHLDLVVWSELKNWFLENVFDHKCGFCEVRLTRDHGAAEHFRPRGGVTYRKRARPSQERASR
jgi:hypothetical protein